MTDVRTLLTDVDPVIEKFFPRLLCFSSRVFEPCKDLAYNLTIANLTPDSSINI